MQKISYGSAHGRFQPLHNEHVEYLLESKSRCDFLWIGITQPNIRFLEKSPHNPHRSVAENNPLTYYERIEMISEALQNENIDRNEFNFVPFPIDSEDCLGDFIPTDIPIFTTICDDWNRYKIDMLAGKGYKIIVLRERPANSIRGLEIRKGILEGNHYWKKQVPQATIDIVMKYNVRERLIKLTAAIR